MEIFSVIHEPLNGFRVRNDSNTGQVYGWRKGKSLYCRTSNAVRKAIKKNWNYPALQYGKA